MIKKFIRNIRQPDIIDIFALSFSSGSFLAVAIRKLFFNDSLIQDLEKNLVKPLDIHGNIIDVDIKNLQTLNDEYLQNVNENNLQSDIDEFKKLSGDILIDSELSDIQKSKTYFNSKSGNSQNLPLVRGGQDEVAIANDLQNGQKKKDPPTVIVQATNNKKISEIITRIYIWYIRDTVLGKYIKNFNLFIYSLFGLSISGGGTALGIQMIFIIFPGSIAGFIFEWFVQAPYYSIIAPLLFTIFRNLLITKQLPEEICKTLCETTKDYVNEQYRIKMSKELKKIYDLGLQLGLFKNDFPITQCSENAQDVVLHPDLLFDKETVIKEIKELLQRLQGIQSCSSAEDIVENVIEMSN